MVWRIFTFWGKKSLFFAKSFQKLSHFFYFIHFQFCCNLLNNCFIFIWWSQKFSFLFDSNRVFFSNFWQKNIGKWTPKLVPKTYSKMEKKLSIIWTQELSVNWNHNLELVQIIDTRDEERNTSRKLGSLTPKFRETQKIMKNKVEKKSPAWLMYGIKIFFLKIDFCDFFFFCFQKKAFRSLYDLY